MIPFVPPPPPANQVAPAVAAAVVSVSPRAPIAGRVFRIGIEVRAAGEDAPVATGRITCRARIDGRALPARSGAFRGGVATCVWRIPLRTRGKRFVATIDVRTASGYVLQTVTRTIR